MWRNSQPLPFSFQLQASLQQLSNKHARCFLVCVLIDGIIQDCSTLCTQTLRSGKLSMKLLQWKLLKHMTNCGTNEKRI